MAAIPVTEQPGKTQPLNPHRALSRPCRACTRLAKSSAETIRIISWKIPSLAIPLLTRPPVTPRAVRSRARHGTARDTRVRGRPTRATHCSRGADGPQQRRGCPQHLAAARPTPRRLRGRARTPRLMQPAPKPLASGQRLHPRRRNTARARGHRRSGAAPHRTCCARRPHGAGERRGLGAVRPRRGGEGRAARRAPLSPIPAWRLSPPACCRGAPGSSGGTWGAPCPPARESQNRRIVGFGRVLWRSSSPAPLSRQGHLEQVTQKPVQVSFECLHGEAACSCALPSTVYGNSSSY